MRVLNIAAPNGDGSPYWITFDGSETSAVIVIHSGPGRERPVLPDDLQVVLDLLIAGVHAVVPPNTSRRSGWWLGPLPMVLAELVAEAIAAVLVEALNRQFPDPLKWMPATVNRMGDWPGQTVAEDWPGVKR